MCSTVPPNPPTGQDVIDAYVALVATIRRHAFDRKVTPADALIDIRDAIREFNGEFTDQE